MMFFLFFFLVQFDSSGRVRPCSGFELDLLSARGWTEKRTNEDTREKTIVFFSLSQRRLPKSHPNKKKNSIPTSRPRKKKNSLHADAHGEAKVAYPWLAPTEPAKWKEEHTVFVVLGGWAIAISSAMKIFGGGKKEEKSVAEAVAAPAK